MKNKKIKNENEFGFVALTSVLIILAIVLAVGLSLGLLSVGEAQMGLQKNQSSQAYYLSNLCAEKALMELKKDNNYSGETIFDIEGGDCTILIEGADPWTVKIFAAFLNQTKKMKIVVGQVSPIININSWQEVANF